MRLTPHSCLLFWLQQPHACMNWGVRLKHHHVSNMLKQRQKVLIGLFVYLPLTQVLLSDRRSRWTNLCREERTHSSTRCVHLTRTRHVVPSYTLEMGLTSLSSSSCAVNQQYELSGRVLPALYPEDSVWLVQEAERPGRRVPWVSTQGQHQVKKVSSYTRLSYTTVGAGIDVED